MKKHVAIAYVIVFVLLFLVPAGACILFGSHLEQTNYEQRQAAEKPVLSLDTIDGYPQAYEAYFNDRLPLRNQMITANSLMNLRLFKQSAVKKVIVGNQGWLFYNPDGSDGDPIADCLGTFPMSDEELERYTANLVAVKNSLEARGKAFAVMIVPNKESMYGSAYLPKELASKSTGIRTRADQLAEYLSRHTDLTVVYPKDHILSAMAQDPDRIYYRKTDTHWNDLGAYIGTKDLLDSLGVSIPPLQEQTFQVTGKNAGDLAVMLGMADFLKYDDVYSLKDPLTAQPVENVYPLEGNTMLMLSSTTGADERSLFLVRDSFTEAMMPYISTQFNTCCFVRIEQYHPDMLLQYPADIVVLEVAERYLWNLERFQVE